MLFLLENGAVSAAKNRFEFDAALRAISFNQYEILVDLLENGYGGDKHKLQEFLEATYITPEYRNYTYFLRALKLVGGDIKKVEALVADLDRRNKRVKGVGDK